MYWSFFLSCSISSMNAGSIPFPSFVPTEFDLVEWVLNICFIGLNVVILITTFGLKQGKCYPFLQVRNLRIRERLTYVRHPIRCLLESSCILYYMVPRCNETAPGFSSSWCNGSPVALTGHTEIIKVKT